MKANTLSPMEIFGNQIRYVVPLYQRPYVWDEEHQWAPLWEDIGALLTHQDSGHVARLWTHFLGAIVLDAGAEAEEVGAALEERDGLGRPRSSSASPTSAASPTSTYGMP